MTRTPGPWRTGEQEPTDINAADNRLVLNAAGDCKDEEDIANAAFIVLACNAHDALVEALRMAQDLMTVMTVSPFAPTGSFAWQEAENTIRAVLAKVEGEKE